MNIYRELVLQFKLLKIYFFSLSWILSEIVEAHEENEVKIYRIMGMGK